MVQNCPTRFGGLALAIEAARFLEQRDSYGVEVCSRGPMNAVAVPHLADVIGDTDAIANCVLAKVRYCIFALGRALGDSKPPENLRIKRSTT
jgi:hypothetical protein